MILLECDVLLDAVPDRAYHAGEANALLDYVERAGYSASMAWHTVANANSASVHFAAGLAMADFEDALQVAAVRNCGAWYIVTRNIKDYARSPIPVLRPGEALTKIR